MELFEGKVESSLKKPRIHDFLEDIIKLCIKHRVSIDTTIAGTKIWFCDWDIFINLEVDAEGASLYWSRIQTEIVVRRRKAGD